jgi:hypothetical protein
MNDVIKILGERWTYVYSSLYYGLWEYDKETHELKTENTVSFLISEIDQRIEEIKKELENPDADPSYQAALDYLYKIKEKLNN